MKAVAQNWDIFFKDASKESIIVAPDWRTESSFI
jgi:hypothetical protein